MATQRTLYYGDNLDVLRGYIPDESVDLIYLDPPFNSKADYNILFKEQTGEPSEAQIKAFTDSWKWSEGTFRSFCDTTTRPEVAQLLIGLVHTFGRNDITAYLLMMAPRLIELHRVLKPAGTLYLHCDPIASHHIKALMDAIFHPANFVNEIIWKRTTTKSDYKQGAKNWPRVHDVLLHYAKNRGKIGTFNQPFGGHDPDYIREFYRDKDPDGRLYQLTDLTAPGSGRRGHPQYEFMGVTRYWRYGKEKMLHLLKEGRIVQRRPGVVPRYKTYLDEMPGTPVPDVWTDIPPVQGRSREFLGYPTQKPIRLLNRIITTSSDKGDLILDPFCGCGTTIVAAERLKRNWIGIDITAVAVALMKHRLATEFKLKERKNYQVVGEPVSVADAEALARQDRFQFQLWALGLVGARPRDAQRGRDYGIDGRLFFSEGELGKTPDLKSILVQVKSGHTSVRDVRDLRGTMEREGAAIGVLVTLEDPTEPMIQEVEQAGTYHSTLYGKSYPKLQILTVGGLLSGSATVQYPEQPQAWLPQRRASRSSSRRQGGGYSGGGSGRTPLYFRETPEST
jgi:DNA modification methylase